MMKKRAFFTILPISTPRMVFQPPQKCGLLAVVALSEARGMLDQNEVLTTQCWQCPGGRGPGHLELEMESE